jgi:ribulose-phosphate 3-epimerase
MKITIAPSILAGNFADLRASLIQIRESGTHWILIDIMDGFFVPNLVFDP